MALIQKEKTMSIRSGLVALAVAGSMLVFPAVPTVRAQDQPDTYVFTYSVLDTDATLLTFA